MQQLLRKWAFAFAAIAMTSSTANAIPSPQPITVALAPIADTYTQQGTPTTNYGASPTVLIRKDSANALSRNGYFEFDLASLPVTFSQTGVNFHGTPLATRTVTPPPRKPDVRHWTVTYDPNHFAERAFR